VFPVSRFFFVLWAVSSAALGALLGALVSVCAFWMRRKSQSLWWDVSLGSVGFILGFLLCVFVPFPENTVYEKLSSGAVVATK